MEHKGVQELDGPRKSGVRKRLLTLALMACVAAGMTGCASSQWTFGASRWVTGDTRDGVHPNSDRPNIIMIVPCFFFDCFFFPVAIIHDQWPTSAGHEDNQ